MVSKAIVGGTEWKWDGGRGAWTKARNGLEEAITDDGVNVLEALGGAEGEETHLLVGDLVWSNRNGVLTTTTPRRWKITVAETPVGYVVKAFGYGTDMTYFPKSSLHDALYDAALWADTLWSQTLRDAEGRVWQWSAERWAYILNAGKTDIEVGYDNGVWYVKEGDKQRLVKYDNPIQATRSVVEKPIEKEKAE